jgi:cell wall-associated NlpC family hydrolase
MVSILRYRRKPFLYLVLLALAGLTACASAPQQPVSAPPAITPAAAEVQPPPHPGLAIARDMVGTPYRYGGASPKGFDCSGLVYYSYRKAGIKVPRTTREQYRRSEHIKLSSLRPGDLVFFRISRDKPAHVGIYAGSGQFIHAPSNGKQVSYASLVDPYWEARVVGAGRLR